MRKLGLFVLLMLAFQAKGQDWEIGLFGGVSSYRGDLAPRIVPSEIHPSYGIGIKRNVSRFFTFTLDFKQGKISGDDRNFDHHQSRNLRFYSPVTEVSTTVEFNFFPFLKGLKPKQFTPFVFSGFSMFRFNPKTIYQGSEYELRNMRTEGQGIQEDAPELYSLYQPAIPIGGGFKLRVKDRFNIALRVGYRATFTDYLDDVGDRYPNLALLAEQKSDVAAALSNRSTEPQNNFKTNEGKRRGDNQTNDWFVFAGIRVSYYIQNPECFDF